jgi:type I restriction enzyme S subunit
LITIQLLEAFERVADAPNAIDGFRRLILALGLRGSLTRHGNATAKSTHTRRGAINDGMSELLSVRPRYRWSRDGAIPDDRDSPPGWVSVRLGDAGVFVNGVAFKPSDWGKSGRPIIRIQNLTGVASDFNFTDRNVAPDNILREGDILVSWSATLDAFRWRGPEAVLNQHIFKVIPNEAAVTHDFLYWLLKHEVRALAESQHAHGLAMLHINRGPFLAHPVLLPPLGEQELIVAKVKELMAACDELESAADSRERIRKSLRISSLHELTASRDDPAEIEAAARFYTHESSRVIARSGDVPDLRRAILDLAFAGRLRPGSTDDNAPRALREVAKLQNGYAFKSEWFVRDGTRLLRNANVGHGRLRWTDVVYLPSSRADEFQRFALGDGDVVLSLDRPFIATGTKVAHIAASDLPCLLLQRVGRFVFDRSVLDARYLFLWICSPHFDRQINPGRSNGVPHVSSKEVEAAVIRIPEVAEQTEIVAKVDALLALCDELEGALASVEADRARLLDALLHEAAAG